MSIEQAALHLAETSIFTYDTARYWLERTKGDVELVREALAVGSQGGSIGAVIELVMHQRQAQEMRERLGLLRRQALRRNARVIAERAIRGMVDRRYGLQ